ncbi:hypothetical protein NSQ93_10660 [Bacillus sp. FSL W8-0445]|jgi:hypothetical protein|uniref:Uncharacterized protein n=1 Tax=Bacillus licheniformis TaxID=1402 RepID=A0AB37GT32_BACLI|nr:MULTISPECIES: hypothetical protein [Bacillus]MBJ7885852.1 hypothetical protein [Bacillaceae bacterium HSR45]MDP4082304.1 hypothetical protein [Bacillota bacterium]AMR11731.1 hypothetical protein AB684_16740 [Bacillus licheniformis]AOP16482.1 hypothetical protein BL1202_03560 [Bacillus licheniformis]APJ28199.1 hypothetical protein BSZ43_16205 [Bacillus sp. H15-1]
MKKTVLPLAATFILVSSTIFSLPESAGATSNTVEEEWVTIDEAEQSSPAILENALEPAFNITAKKDYTTNWRMKKVRAGNGWWRCKYSMLTTARAKKKINKIEAKSRLYAQSGGLTKSVTDTNKNSSYAGAEAIGGVTGGWGCKGSAYGNSRYEQKGYKTVTHQKKYNIFDLL